MMLSDSVACFIGLEKNETISNKLNEDLRNFGLDIPNVSLTSDLTSYETIICCFN